MPCAAPNTVRPGRMPPMPPVPPAPPVPPVPPAPPVPPGPPSIPPTPPAPPEPSIPPSDGPSEPPPEAPPAPRPAAGGAVPLSFDQQPAPSPQTHTPAKINLCMAQRTMHAARPAPVPEAADARREAGGQKRSGGFPQPATNLILLRRATAASGAVAFSRAAFDRGGRRAVSGRLLLRPLAGPSHGG